MEKVPVFCGKDCGGNACPLLAVVDKGRVVRIINNPAGGRFLTGCRRGYSMPLELYDSGRILTPLIRTGPRGSGSFRPASWDEALNLTARRLGEIRDRFGPESVLNLSSSGQTGAVSDTTSLTARFLACFGGFTKLTSNYSNGAASFVLPYILGRDWRNSGFDPAVMKYSKMIILWGANPLEARLGTEVDLRLMEAAKRGARIFVIDPVKTPTARRLKAQWLPCKPGTDAALMLAVLYVLLKDNTADRSSIARYSHGFGFLEDYVLGKTGGKPRDPKWASGITGLSAEEIIGFAGEYACSKPALLFPGYSIQRVFAGEETFRLTIALQIATGNFGLKGGSTGSLNNRLPQPRVGTLPVPDTSGMPSVPVVRWPDLVLEGKSGGFSSDIKAVYTAGGNFLNQGCDINKNTAAFNKLDFSVCHELFLTPTARYSDVIFPAAHSLEKEDIGFPWAGNFLAYKTQAVSPPGDCRTDYDIFSALAERLGFREAFTEGRTASEWISFFLKNSEIPDTEEFRRTGVYLAEERERQGLAEFTSDPIRFPLSTPSGKAEIYCETYFRETGAPPCPAWQDPPKNSTYPLLLITPKSAYRTHSQGDGIAGISGPARHALEMNPADAGNRGLTEGDRVKVFNERGTLIVSLRINPDIKEGVARLPEGVWYRPDNSGSDTAGSANMLSSTAGTFPGQANIMHALAVQAEKYIP